MKLVGVDVGGTFTDIIYTDTEQGVSHIHKVPTTREDPSIGMVAGIKSLCEKHGIEMSSLNHLFHGTTIATNAILEHDGAKTGMITTQGYRDILHIGRHQRPQNYSIQQEIPWQDRPLVQRRYREAVEERIVPPSGAVQTPLNEEQVRQALQRLQAQGVESVVVCFLFSYLNPRHEERVRQIIEQEFPQFYVTTSASISPQFREFERFTTASLNAFIGPKVQGYVRQLEERVEQAGMTGDLHIMSSSGGVATAKMVSEKPVLTLLSGPAAGVLGGEWTGALSNRRKLITFDVGGTSADIAIITEKGFSESSARDTWIAGFPVLVPMIDIHTIGAGGGSIAHVDAGVAFRVGPRSAGSRPGPACYGHGGTQPTVTDAHAVLGRLDAENFLGGEMSIYPQRADEVVAALGQQLGLSALEAAEGILTIVNNSMANAVRAKTVQKGYDPREFSLIGFGGAGPMHAVEVAQILGMQEVIIPPHPGITSATGLLTTDLKYDATQTVFMHSTEMDFARINETITNLKGQVWAQLQESGFSQDELFMYGYFDCRYVGQGYELRVAVPDELLTETSIQGVWDSFHSDHEREYGHSFSDSPIEIVNFRLTGIAKMPKIGTPTVLQSGRLEDAVVKVEKSAFRVGGELQLMDTVFYQRDEISVGVQFSGPCVVLQKDTTTIIPPNCHAVLEAHGNLIIQVEV